MSAPATTGTYNFQPSLGEAVLYAYGLCGIRPTMLTQQHFETARMAANLVLSRWSADGVNLWQVDLQCVALSQGCPTYQVPNNTVVILDAYYTINTGTAEIDRVMLPVSRTEYASYPNKHQQGSPTVYWMDRLLNPTVTLWPTPNGQQASFKYYRLRQAQDSQFQGGVGAEVPTYYLEAFALALAWRFALTWAPALVAALKPLADEAYASATKQNVESAAIYISPSMGGYWRQ